MIDARESLPRSLGAVALAAGLIGFAVLGGGARAGRVSFDRHVARQVGAERELCALLLDAARAELGARRFLGRSAAFVLATTPPGRRAIPARFRDRAIRAIVSPMVGRRSRGLAYLGLREPSGAEACAGLVESR